MPAERSLFTALGDIVFTDPQNWEDIARARAGLSHTPYRGGQLLLARADGHVTRLARMTGFANGLAFHRHGSLIVGLTVEHRLLRFPWDGDQVGEPETWREFDQQFGPEGMAFHKDRLYVNGSDGDRIAVLDRAGQCRDDRHAPAKPTNLCFQDDTLWVTFGLSGQLASYPV